MVNITIQSTTKLTGFKPSQDGLTFEKHSQSGSPINVIISNINRQFGITYMDKLDNDDYYAWYQADVVDTRFIVKIV